jgi:hypothetical protein
MVAEGEVRGGLGWLKGCSFRIDQIIQANKTEVILSWNHGTK